jgi:hypothetical protein
METHGTGRSLPALLSSMLLRQISRCIPLLATAILAAACGAQVIGDPGTLPNGRHIPFPPDQQNLPESTPRPPTAPRNPAAAPAPGPAPFAPATEPSAAPVTSAPSLLDKPAQPAKITLSGGRLSVTADNSSLTDILHQLASTSGMTIDGLDKDTRVFGTYGPADPHEVLSMLLDGAGYNVLMLGDTDTGTPRQLVLTVRNNGPLTQQPQQPVNTMAEQDDDQDESMPLNNNPPAGEIQPHPPMPPTQPQNSNGTVKSPQQILQEMQQMRQQRQQQQQDQESNPQ